MAMIRIFSDAERKAASYSCFNEIAHGFIIRIVFTRRARDHDFVVIDRIPVVCQKCNSLSLNWATIFRMQIEMMTSIPFDSSARNEPLPLGSWSVTVMETEKA